jgi:hypothetical protein
MSLLIKHNFTPKGFEDIQHNINAMQIYNTNQGSIEKATANKHH